ncbi:hypothetical protein CTI12_AA504340 [Artemisia annua]|uniref:Uncharacterized protein n=1 Tax=Artemisia annua TaxID=35608 RepID=A0A2U1LD36_ARTAN|nr:hypothetical protein CTI12_AA504340 [Artemisia annua]
MDILNKKSMLFLLAITLLICSSYADDHLPSARMEDRKLAGGFLPRPKPAANLNQPKNIEMYKRIAAAHPNAKKGFKFAWESGKEVAVACQTNCQPADRRQKLCSAFYCVYQMINQNTMTCKKVCGKLPTEGCYYDITNRKAHC